LGKQSCKKLKAISLSNNTIQQRISEIAEDICFQLILNLKFCLHGMFAIQLGESTDVSNVSQPMAFVSWASTASIEEAILFCAPLLTTTQSTDIL